MMAFILPCLIQPDDPGEAHAAHPILIIIGLSALCWAALVGGCEALISL